MAFQKRVEEKCSPFSFDCPHQCVCTMKKGAPECEYQEQRRIFQEECEEDFEKDERLKGIALEWSFEDVYDVYETFADAEARIGDKEYPEWFTVSDQVKVDIIKSARVRADRFKQAGGQQQQRKPKRPAPPMDEQDA